MTTNAKLTLATLVSLLSTGLQAADSTVPTAVINDVNATTIVGVAANAAPQAPVITPQATTPAAVPAVPAVAAAPVAAPSAPAVAAPQIAPPPAPIPVAAPAAAPAPQPQSAPVPAPTPLQGDAPKYRMGMMPRDRGYRPMRDQMMPPQGQANSEDGQRDYSSMQMPPMGQRQQMPRQAPRGMGRGHGPSPRLMGQLNQLDLTDAQRESISKNLEDQQLARSAQQEAMQAERDKLRQLYRQERPDAKAIGAVYDSIFAMRRARIEATINMRNTIMDELTEEQRKQLKAGSWGRPPKQ